MPWRRPAKRMRKEEKMKLGERIRERYAKNAVRIVQTGEKAGHPFHELDRYSPLATRENSLYTALREAVPVIDAAIYKLVRLTGGFTVTCRNPAARKELSRFLENVNVCGTQRGIHAFLDGYFEQLLTYGTAVGEMVTDERGELCALYHPPLDGLELQRGAHPLEVRICRREGGACVPLPCPELLLLSVLNPEPGSLKGTSLLKGLPFVSSILLKIYHTIGVNWERLGNVRFAVTYKPQNDALDRAYAKERAMEIARQWGQAMKGGAVSDFIAVGDVDIRVIGADNQIMDSQVPVRQMLEQIVAKTGLPPFMLGLSWSATERMSQQQADMLTSELEAYRRTLTPVVGQIARTFLQLRGWREEPEVVWADISLQDEVELSRARLYSAQASRVEASLSTQAAREKEE